MLALFFVVFVSFVVFKLWCHNTHVYNPQQPMSSKYADSGQGSGVHVLGLIITYPEPTDWL